MSVFILFEGKPGAKDSHEERAKGLSAVTGNCGYGNIDTTTATAVPNLNTLIFWGHGESSSMCGKSVVDLCKVIADWKKLNPKLKTIEIITCNARHAKGKAAAYVDKLKNHLKWDPRIRGTFSMTVKALPVGVGGKHNVWSILLAHGATGSWVYITAPGVTDAEMMQAKNLIEFDRGTTGAISYTGDLAEKANKVVSARAKNPVDVSGNPFNVDWTMTYGYFNTLRACLVVV